MENLTFVFRVAPFCMRLFSIAGTNRVNVSVLFTCCQFQVVCTRSALHLLTVPTSLKLL